MKKLKSVSLIVKQKCNKISKENAKKRREKLTELTNTIQTLHKEP